MQLTAAMSHDSTIALLPTPIYCSQEKQARWEEDAYYKKAWEEVLDKQEKERVDR